VGAGLFENLPERCVASRGNAAGEARMREPVRDHRPDLARRRALEAAMIKAVGQRRAGGGANGRSSPAALH
jgi:hypothetical protein